MTKTITKTITKLAGAAMGAALAFAVASLPAATARTHAAGATPSEQQQLQGLYRKAKAQGGKLTVYMGGDAPTQWDFIAKAFEAQFPDVQLHLVTDLSKYHDQRIDRQLADHDLVADAAILQTTYDFDRWKRQGQLLKYKPVGYDDVFNNAKDPEGYWTGTFYAAFSPIVNTGHLPTDPSAFKSTDLLAPAFKDKLIMTYPNDDDAVLFGYKLIIDRYGWAWLRGLMAQNPKLTRGVPGSAIGVANGTYLATPVAAGDARPNGLQVLPSSERFGSWAQRGAIFKQAKHRAAAELFLSWVTSKATQAQVFGTWTWSVRRDVAPPNGLEPLSSYNNTDVNDFVKFMSDRAAVKRFRTEVERYVGPVRGADPADPGGTLGDNPGRF